MIDDETLLAYIAQRHIFGKEDAATDALAFILNRSAGARRAFADFLAAGASDTPAIVQVSTRHTLPSGAIPDLACFDESGKTLAFVESKFWAQLQPRQPVQYWQALPADAPSVLLFIAPDSRVSATADLWPELARRLAEAGWELGELEKSDGRITALAKHAPRRLMLCSWESLLERLAQSALAAQDEPASYDIAQLQGLAKSVIRGQTLPEDDAVKYIVAQAVYRAVQMGWGDTSGFTVGTGFGYYGRYLRLAGAYAWLGKIDRAANEFGIPFCLTFGKYGGVSNPALATTDEVRDRVVSLERPDVGGIIGGLWLPLYIPADAGNEAAIHAIVSQMAKIGLLIDPDGPTYRKDAPGG